MNELVEVEYVVKPKHSQTETKHTLAISIHRDIVKNHKRVISHCYSIGRKTYGTNCVMMKITKHNGEVLYVKD